MMSQPLVIYHDTPAVFDLRLSRLSHALGVTCRLMDATRLSGELEQAKDHSLCVMASASTMWGLYTSGTLIQALLRKTRFLFIYGFCPDDTHSALAYCLTEGALSRVCSFARDDVEYQVGTSHPDITKDFSGLSFGPINKHIDFGFMPSSSRCRPLVAVDGMPLWGLMEKRDSTVFLLACREIADIDELTDGNLGISERFSRLVPASMFVKFVFKQYCWHAPHRFANVIIDDPLLTMSYGCLNYHRLWTHMESVGFSTTIAFIPWNYKRTQPAVADLFRTPSTRLSVCVHGCDHTKAEFAITDLRKLNAKLLLASHRMSAHESSTGLPSCKVMVFPQGQFSTQSLVALKSNNYRAAVNARVTPSDTKQQRDVTVAECLGLAVTRYGFPLFLRRYPLLSSPKGRRTGTIEEFAGDLFFGKPALIAEHHNAFKDRGNSLLGFVSKLNSLNGRLEWAGLGDVIARTYLEKDVSEQLRVCRIYTNYQLIVNDDDRSRNYIITKAEDGKVSVENVLVNGKPTRFTIRNSNLQLFTNIPAGGTATVQIAYKNVLPGADGPAGVVVAGRVLIRRLLCELRDNVLWHHEWLLAVAYAAKRWLHRSHRRVPATH